MNRQALPQQRSRVALCQCPHHPGASCDLTTIGSAEVPICARCRTSCGLPSAIQWVVAAFERGVDEAGRHRSDPNGGPT